MNSLLGCIVQACYTDIVYVSMDLLVSLNLTVWAFIYVFKPDLKSELLLISLHCRTLISKSALVQVHVRH